MLYYQKLLDLLSPYPLATQIFFSALAASLSFFFLVLLFRPLELAFPAKPHQRFFRPAFLTDVCFFFGQYLLWNSLVFGALLALGNYLDAHLPTHFRNAVAAQPFWLQAIEAILLSDVLIYWAHRLQHNNAFLWRFHSTHHTAEHLDWLAAHREHPLDTIYTVGLINLPALLLGIRLEPLAILIAFRGIWAIYIHSNVRLPIGPLRWFIGAPELHHWHHDKNQHAGNYANISPLMDILFGTYTCPPHEPASFGISEPAPKSYLSHLLLPLLPNSLRTRILQNRALENRAREEAPRDLSPPISPTLPKESLPLPRASTSQRDAAPPPRVPEGRKSVATSEAQRN